MVGQHKEKNGCEKNFTPTDRKENDKSRNVQDEGDI
jgi:hypothetical protein